MVASAARRPARLIFTISSNKSIGFLRRANLGCASSTFPCESQRPLGLRVIFSPDLSLRRSLAHVNEAPLLPCHNTTRLFEGLERGVPMKAVVFDQHGGPEVLKYTDAPDPIIRPNEVLVRVRACALNHLDLWVRRGNPNISIPLVFQTAWHMLLSRAELQPGEDVLILGAGSGVGSAAIQVAKFFGARVIATAGNDEKLQKAKQLGADFLINHKTQKIHEEVRSITNKRGVDVVFEHVGTATWDGSFASLATGGRLVTCGATTGFDAKVDLRFLFSRQLSLLGSYMGTKSELHSVMRLVASGRFKPVVDRIFPLAACAQAHAYLESRSQFGKVVLAV